ncbi:glycosyltransferase family 2 protein [Micromonospora sp. SH-82]|uniref:glycosyltransferase family 2 protein n=1 Tax=Micromonospora sp. SH-82 TaxID=3132938 RepID=UPI003EB95D71
MTLSVVIPYFRQVRALDLSLGALAAQDPDAGRFEVVIVDDDSRDEVESLVETYRDRLDLRLVRLPVNLGRAAARNRGVAEATGERIVLLDADSLADPGLVGRHARFHIDHPEKVLLGARIEHDWRAVHDPTRPPPPSAYHTDLRYRWGLDPETFSDSPAPWIFGYSHHMSVPTAQIRALGGFDERFVRWGHEDVEFSYRLFLAAGRQPGHFHFDPLALCHHVPHFRNALSNWAEADGILPYMIDKHRTMEVELYKEGPLGVNAALPTYLERLGSLHDRDNRAALDEILAALPHRQEPGRLGIGIGLADRMASHPGTELVDHRPPAEAPPGLIGLRLPYPGDRFADLLNLDVWRIASPEHLSKMVIESLRVARAVYLGGSKGLPTDDLGLVDCPDHLCDMLRGHTDSEVIHDGDHAWVIRIRRR